MSRAFAAARAAHTAFLLALVLGVLCGACGGRSGEGGPRVPGTYGLPEFDARLARNGERMFRDRGFGRTGVACADCHSEADESVRVEGRIFAGHSVVGAAGRTSVWNGTYTGPDVAATAAGAAQCAHQYQERGASIRDALAPEEREALLAFFSAISTGDEAKKIPWDAPARPGERTYVKEVFIREIEAITTRSGDAERGRELFGAACAFCHGEDAAGSGPTLRRLHQHADRLPWIVRAGRDAMPFFSRDRLSNQDVADLWAYVTRMAR